LEPTELEFSSVLDTMETAVKAGTRRTPMQPRSQRTLEKVLDAASSLLAQIPLEELTSTRIAIEAGISIGTFYRFFPDKQSIVDAVAIRHVEDFRRLLARKVMPTLQREMSNLADFQPARMLNLVVDAYVAYLDEHADFRAISFGQHISAATKEVEASPAVGLPAMLKDFMMEQLGVPNTPELDLALRVVSEAGERLIAFAYEQPTREERDRILGEMKRMLAGYLFPSG
jgi:AcrR family transcriptional regulator